MIQLLRMNFKCFYLESEKIEEEKNAALTEKMLCVVYGDGSIAECTARKYFAGFKYRHFYLDYQELYGVFRYSGR